MFTIVCTISDTPKKKKLKVGKIMKLVKNIWKKNISEIMNKVNMNSLDALHTNIGKLTQDNPSIRQLLQHFFTIRNIHVKQNTDLRTSKADLYGVNCQHCSQLPLCLSLTLSVTACYSWMILDINVAVAKTCFTHVPVFRDMTLMKHSLWD